MYALSPVADDAFPSRLASLPKQRKSMVSHRASYCLIIMYTLSAVTGDAFPQRLTSLSKRRKILPAPAGAFLCKEKTLQVTNPKASFPVLRRSAYVLQLKR